MAIQELAEGDEQHLLEENDGKHGQHVPGDHGGRADRRREQPL